MHLYVGHTCSSTVSLYVHARNYSETDKLNINHLDKVNEPYILSQMIAIDSKKKRIQIKIFLENCIKQKTNVNSQK